ncbi:MAG TPA: isochorismatase family protein [Caulifigura sp.]|jgi:nicotinamidase-related amidase|nr:isochorismatase family protein [Caulifigura sp.]
MTELPNVDRRGFLTASAAGLAIGSTAQADDAVPTPTRQLHLHPRYHRWHVDAGKEWLETNTGPAQLDWTIPIGQVGLVLVDVWSGHYLKDTAARADEIVEQRFVPLLAGCRKAGLTVIHAPSPPQAIGHPNHVAATDARPAVARDNWPPAAFRSKAGPYQSYRRPMEPREPEIRKVRDGLTIHPRACPVGNEPVVATGDELHAVCKQKGVLFLLFAGFNTNACILVRDYGTLAMSQRGYEVVLLRDCTTGMESPDSRPTMAQTNGAVLFLEMFGQYSTTSEDVLAGLVLT